MSGKPRIPAWQSATNTSPESPATSAPEPDTEQTKEIEKTEEITTPAVEAPVPTEGDLEESESTQLLDQAARFLEDPAIRDAPREKKVAFLESKGVQAEDIETLLGTSSQEDNAVDLEEVGQRAWSTPSSPNTQVAQAPSPPREIPPIVTYPEFLAQTEKPPPLITTQRLLNTAYITGGLMATMYGLSKFILAPMTENLHEARHDFAAHTQEQLEEFNKRLVGSVSEDPASKTKKITDVLDDISEADSDPTELYHRDYGTQTTPTLSRRPSVSSSNDPEPVVTAHENRLKIIKSHLEELETTRTSNNASVDTLKTKVSDLTTYLSEMSYQNQYYSTMGGLYAPNYGLPSGKDGKNDQIEVLKNDIRAVKGVFLSARNFPAGGRSTPTMPTGRVGS